jgi:hypothetical protein
VRESVIEIVITRVVIEPARTCELRVAVARNPSEFIPGTETPGSPADNALPRRVSASIAPTPVVTEPGGVTRASSDSAGPEESGNPDRLGSATVAEVD